VQEAFGLFDFNGDGYISLTEISTYLASVFKTMFMLQPETQLAIGASPEELAKVTAEECFAEGDVDLDGRLCKLVGGVVVGVVGGGGVVVVDVWCGALC
jgi:Ca2+-binding EF-hand superfamily protein